MKKISRGAIAVIAGAIAIPAGVAIARHGDHGHGGWHKMSPAARERLSEGKLAMAKTALKLNPEQEKLWATLETEIRASFKMRAERMAEREKMRDERRKSRDEAKEGDKEASADKPDIAERINKMSQHMSERADRMKAFAAAFSPFYASLSGEQKEVMRPLLRDLMSRGGHGKRWSMGGGWGDQEKWGHSGGWRHHGKDRGGYMERGGGPGRDGGERGGPHAEQFMPEVDEVGPAGDNL